MAELETPNYALVIAKILKLSAGQVKAVIQMLAEGNTIPFIARYRKERTGELDEKQLRSIAVEYDNEKVLFERKRDVLRLLDEQGVLHQAVTGPKLMQGIHAARSLAQINDIYRPYRPKRQTKASVAKDKKLGPLANWFLEIDLAEANEVKVLLHAQTFVSVDRGVHSAEEAIAGAMDILAEEIADDADHRRWCRSELERHGILVSVANSATQDSVYAIYYDYKEAVKRIRPHRTLAINRGEREGYLKVSISLSHEQMKFTLWHRFLSTRQGRHSRADGVRPATFAGDALRSAVNDAYKRLLFPSLEREVRNALTRQAEDHAINIFGQNLAQLLMQPPIPGKTVLGVDPAYRTGCKLAVVDETGKLLHTTVIYPNSPQNRTEEAQGIVLELFSKYAIDLVAIGNGTASRETEAFFGQCIKAFQEETTKSLPYIIVSEAGASVYSASPLAGLEFPDLDVSERSAISIARRIQDPLAELVKIDPKSVGVGQYQHDVSEKRLDEKLAAVVESTVNQVGVDVNTASSSLLSYVSGLNRAVAKNIVDYRDRNGKFSNRQMLASVPRMGPKTLQQCVGFLRIENGDQVLDKTPIHPESYAGVLKLLNHTGSVEAFFADSEYRRTAMEILRAVPVEELSTRFEIGVPTLIDILAALERPGRDPREDIPLPHLRTDVLTIEDLYIGMVLTGTVRNVVDFGAFVDIGIKNDGLIHISQLANHYVSHPLDILSVGDVVTVRVIEVDSDKGRVSLSMKQEGQGAR